MYDKMLLREIRQLNKMTQKQVADYLQCAVSTYGKYETGEREPSISSLIALADLFCVSVDELLGHEVKKRLSSNEEEKVVLGENWWMTSLELEDSGEDSLARLKYDFDLEHAKSLGNNILWQEVKTLNQFHDILLVKDIYAKMDFIQTVSTVNVTDLVKVFGVSKSGYYHWKQNGDVVKKRNEKIAELILEYELPALNSAGYTAVTNYLRSIEGMPELKNISVARTKRIMDEFEIIAEDLRNKKNQVLLKSFGQYDASNAFVARNQLKRVFDLDVEPCTYWCADITEIKTSEGKLYMCAVMDLCGRYLIGYSVGATMDTRLVKRAVRSAMDIARKYVHLNDEPIILHTDRGMQFRNDEFQEFLGSNNLQSSMSKAHNPNDNACIESFFASLKCEYLYRYKLPSFDVAKKMVERYVKFYNIVRVHQNCLDMPERYWMARVK